MDTAGTYIAIIVNKSIAIIAIDAISSLRIECPAVVASVSGVLGAMKREKVPVREMPLLVKVNQAELKRIDELRAALGDFPSRPEVLRRAMERLHAELCGAGRPAKAKAVE
jgi:hypothetical protein